MNQRIESTLPPALGARDAKLGPDTGESSVSRWSDNRFEIAASGIADDLFDSAREGNLGGDLRGGMEDPRGCLEDLPRWPRVLDLLLDELIAGAGEAEAQPFLHRVGARLAADLALGQPGTLTALESAINRRLSQLGWGWCSIRDAERLLIIDHGDYPLMGARHGGAAGHPRLAALSWMLCGLYQGWLDAQGGRAGVSCERCHAHQSLIFHYGGA